MRCSINRLSEVTNPWSAQRCRQMPYNLDYLHALEVSFSSLYACENRTTVVLFGFYN